MQLGTPDAIRKGDFPVTSNPYFGKPFADIELAPGLKLTDLSDDDCDRLVRAACAAKEAIAAERETAAAPHRLFGIGRCLTCGKPKDDELHAELVALRAEMTGVCGDIAPNTGRPCTETGEHVKHRNGMVVWGPGVDEPASAAA